MNKAEALREAALYAPTGDIYGFLLNLDPTAEAHLHEFRARGVFQGDFFSRDAQRRMLCLFLAYAEEDES